MKLKKILSLLAIQFGMWMPAFSQTVVFGQLNFTQHPGQPFGPPVLTLVNYTGPSGIGVIIPATVNGLKVTAIGNEKGKGAFQSTGVTAVTIPGTVTTISSNAFQGCEALAAVTIPRSVINVGSDAFQGCVSLSSVVIPDSVISIGPGAFEGCMSLTSVTIPPPVPRIGPLTFANCTSLQQVTIPRSVTSMGTAAFSNCTSLISVTIPGSVTSLGTNIFAGCTALETATLLKGVVSVGAGMFQGCGNLAEVTIPSGVTRIGPVAFAGCSSLNGVTIPPGVSNIGPQAFYECGSLTSITIPGSVSSIGDVAFEFCTNLSSVTISNGVKVIGTGAFYGCASLGTIVIPGSIAVIPDETFAYCSSLEAVTLMKGVTTLGKNAFQYCDTLNSVSLTPSLLSIGEGALSYCTSLDSIAIPNSVFSIGESAFYGCASLGSVTIPNRITSIRHDTFAYCTSLTNATIPNSVVTIGENAFYGCGNLGSVIIPRSITAIGEFAFANCTDLTGVDFAGSPPSFDSTAFDGDSYATAYYLSGSVGWGSSIAGIPVLQSVPYSLQVSISPPSAIAAGAEWQVDGGTWQNSGATVLNLSVGSHTVSFNTINGWKTPANQTIFANAIWTATALGTYVLPFTIIPTFDISITDDPNATKIEAAVNAAIAAFQTNIADYLTVKIKFVGFADDTSDVLGHSSTSGGKYFYASYIAALRSRAISANDIHSLGNLPDSATDPVVGATQIHLNLTLARVLGLDTGYGSDGFDSTISLNIPLMNLTRPPTNPNDYDLQMVVEHEIDEVLGTSSDLSITTIISPADLFRYTTNLDRTYGTNGDNAYFSVDGTNLWARYNMNPGGDYGDWWSPTNFPFWWAPPGITAHAQVQDAFGSSGLAADVGTNELALLDVVGYTLVNSSPAIGIASGANGQIMISWPANITAITLQESTDLHSWSASATGPNNPAVIATGSTAKFYRLAMTGTPSVAPPNMKLGGKSSPQLRTNVFLGH